MCKLLHGPNLIEHLVARSPAQLLTKRFDNSQWGNACPYGNGHKLGPALQEWRRHLRERVVQLSAHLSLIVAGKSPVAHMPYDANDLVRRRTFNELFVILL